MKRRKLLSASSVLYVSATKIVIIFRTPKSSTRYTYHKRSTPYPSPSLKYVLEQSPTLYPHTSLRTTIRSLAYKCAQACVLHSFLQTLYQ